MERTGEFLVHTVYHPESLSGALWRTLFALDQLWKKTRQGSMLRRLTQRMKLVESLSPFAEVAEIRVDCTEATSYTPPRVVKEK